MQGGRWRHAIACGALAALALLGKYFSVVLVLALVVVALAVPAWRARLRGAGPWLALLAGLLVLLPHLIWLFDQQFLTLRYASRRSEGSLGEALLRLANYSVAQLGYLLPAALFLLWSVRSGERRIAATLVVRSVLRPSLHRELWWLALAPMFVVAAIAVAARTPMASVWGMAQWFAVTALWLAVFGQQGIAPRSDWLRRALPVYWVGVLLAAAAVGYAEARRGSEAATVPRAELAHAVQTLWRERFGGTLPIVAGSGADVMSVAFYAAGATRWWCPTAPTRNTLAHCRRLAPCWRCAGLRSGRRGVPDDGAGAGHHAGGGGQGPQDRLGYNDALVHLPGLSAAAELTRSGEARRADQPKVQRRLIRNVRPSAVKVASICAAM